MFDVDIDKLMNRLKTTTHRSRGSNGISSKAITITAIIQTAIELSVTDTVRFAFITNAGIFEGDLDLSKVAQSEFFNIHFVKFTNNAGNTFKTDFVFLSIAEIIAFYPVRSVYPEDLIASQGS